MTFAAQRYRIIGDSHVHALKAAALHAEPARVKVGWPLAFVRALGASNEFYTPFFEKDDQGIVILPGKIRDRLVGEFCDDAGRVLPPDDTFTFLSLGLHTHTFLSVRRFEVHRYWRVTSVPDRLALSDAAFAAMVLDLNTEVLAFLRLLKSGGHDVAVLSSPPPTRRFCLLAAGYTPAGVLVLDGLVRQVMREAIAALGVAVIEPPAGATPDGFLRADLLNADVADAHHGNPSYGRMVLDDLARRCGFKLA